MKNLGLMKVRAVKCAGLGGSIAVHHGKRRKLKKRMERILNVINKADSVEIVGSGFVLFCVLVVMLSALSSGRGNKKQIGDDEALREADDTERQHEWYDNF